YVQVFVRVRVHMLGNRLAQLNEERGPTGGARERRRLARRAPDEVLFDERREIDRDRKRVDWLGHGLNRRGGRRRFRRLRRERDLDLRRRAGARGQVALERDEALLLEVQAIRTGRYV